MLIRTGDAYGPVQHAEDSLILSARIELARRYGWEARARWIEAAKAKGWPVGYVLEQLNRVGIK